MQVHIWAESLSLTHTHTHMQNNSHSDMHTHRHTHSFKVHTGAHMHTVKQTQTDETSGHPADQRDQCERGVFSDLICLANIHLFSPINNTQQHVFMTLPPLTQFIRSSSTPKKHHALPSGLSLSLFQSMTTVCLCHSLFASPLFSFLPHTPLIMCIVLNSHWSIKTILRRLEPRRSRKTFARNTIFMSYFQNKYVCLELRGKKKKIKIFDTPLHQEGGLIIFYGSS